ncbi:MAG: hypothetical protein ISS11_05720, partial [Candidatus Marinimicrobia bacterium]|nr:hypothetical protein [Candidatus Neomarinimicrobiota bacterium]
SALSVKTWQDFSLTQKKMLSDVLSAERNIEIFYYDYGQSQFEQFDEIQMNIWKSADNISGGQFVSKIVIDDDDNIYVNNIDGDLSENVTYDEKRMYRKIGYYFFNKLSKLEKVAVLSQWGKSNKEFFDIEKYLTSN